MSVDQVDVAHLVEIVGNVKAATGDVMLVTVKKVAHPANLLPRSEADLVAAAVLLLLHRDVMCDTITIGSSFFDRRRKLTVAGMFGRD